jgi:hypothetical protein
MYKVVVLDDDLSDGSEGQAQHFVNVAGIDKINDITKEEIV